jgi:glycosyltransferase involved in cell wall biosynthesis
MAAQAFAFMVFAKAVIKKSNDKKWDIVVATSSRLMTATLAVYVAKRSGAKLYLDIRDLFTDTMKDVLISNPLRVSLPIIKLIEKWTFESADKVNLISAGFLPYFKGIRLKRAPTLYTNGVDEIFVNTDFSSKKQTNMPVVLYAGNIGQGQGLHQIIPQAGLNFNGEVLFKIIGDGSERQNLQSKLNETIAPNIELIDPVSRAQLMHFYKLSDILFMHLNDYEAFKKVLPSKIFEYAATGMPILAGVNGYAADFLSENVNGAYVFKPNDISAMCEGVLSLLEGPRMFDRTDFCAKYLRSGIMTNIARDILR